MNRPGKILKSFRQIAVALAFVLALCAFVPTGIGTQSGILTNAAAAEQNNITLGKTKTFTTVVGGTGTVSYPKKGVTFKSSNSKVLAVTKKGNITAKKAGTAKIYVIYKGKKIATCIVKVKRNRYTGFLNKNKTKTGFVDRQQDGTISNPTVRVDAVAAEFLSRNKVVLTFKMRNTSSINWTRVKKLNRVFLQTKSGTTIVNISNLSLSKGFSLYAGEKMTYKLTLSGSYVKNFVDLTKKSKGSIWWALDWWIG